MGLNIMMDSPVMMNGVKFLLAGLIAGDGMLLYHLI
jgi:hypothetical protein